MEDDLGTSDATQDFQQEQRSEERVPTLGVIVYFLPPSGEFNPLFEGLIYNLSKNGAGVITVNRVAAGSVVKISSAAIGGAPRDAHVQWCTHINDNLYKFGLSLS
jgi:hypothetical protein